ncbi:MAG: hypothetical protein KIG15_06775 [Coriobacteriales bacterium]|nr:hypothetical protein [Coriobacteriales bacterium]
MSQPVHITRSAPDQRIAEASYSGYDQALKALIAWHNETHRDAFLFCPERPCRDAARDLR